ncbi:hypothetical protein [Brevundimonas variabilis]|uniref:DUF7847 domain-containing protein n=1 Tax=Brevundimonas variabilis TaxID=74312 RepID=A0A7W9FFW5_9CAUL|nr:hypothetical protein [Brevundimonas variabilis]MBB5745799.1 hypothetical protein [Brevundimonas variabilis]
MTAIETSGTGRFDLGRVMERTFTVIGRNIVTFLLAAVILTGIPSVITVIGQGGMPFPTSRQGWLILATGWFLSLLGAYLLQAAIVHVTVNALNNRTVTLRTALGIAIGKMLPLLGLGLLVFLATMLGMVLLIIPGIIVAVMLCVAGPVLVMEKRSILESFGRSRALTKGFRWPIFGLFVIYMVVATAISGTVTGVSVATGGAMDGSANPVVTLIFTPLIAVVQAIIGSAGIAALYYELRTAKEGVGTDELAELFD